MLDINNTLILNEFAYNTKFMVRPIKRNVDEKLLTKEVYVILTNTKTAMGKIIKNVTRSEYNHASISLDKTFNNVYGFGRNTDENESGFIVEKMDGGIYRDNNANYVQLALKVTEKEYKSIEKIIRNFQINKYKFKFNKLGLILSGLNIPYNKQYEFFCSQFISYVFVNSGIFLFDKNYGLVRPNDFLVHPDFKVISKGKVINKANRDKKVR